MLNTQKTTPFNPIISCIYTCDLVHMKHCMTKCTRTLHMKNMQTHIIEVSICKRLYMDTSMICVCIFFICRVCITLHIICNRAVKGHVDDHACTTCTIVPTMLTELLHPLQFGFTALHDAARGGHTTCVEYLLSTPGIEVNIKDKVS